jgi:hypothetical protein
MISFIDESFLAAEHGPNRANVTDDYLRRRGWQETPRAREYLQAIRTTPPTLYEVWDVAFGEWIEVRDRLREEPPRRLVEHSGSQVLQRWDCFVTRVVHPRDEVMLTGGVLSFTRSVADEIEKLVKRAAGRRKRDLADGLFLQGWLKGLLEAARRPLPELANTDGDPLLPSTTRLPIADGAAMEIERRMDSLAGRERMDRALAMLRPALGALIGPGLTSHEDVAHALRQPPSSHHSRRTRVPEPSPDLDPAAIAEAFNRIKEAHYRRTLDEPVPMLSNRTPRECARSKQGRRKLANWIKEIENGELRQAAGTDVPPYDVSWMWQELGVEDER